METTTSKTLNMKFGNTNNTKNIALPDPLDTLDADTVTADKRLERLHGYGYYFAILRPSFALEN